MFKQFISIFSSKIRQLTRIVPVLKLIDQNDLRWQVIWPQWRLRKGWWMVEANASIAQSGAMLIIEEGNSASALALTGRGPSKRILRLHGGEKIYIRLIAPSLGSKTAPNILFSPCSVRFARSRMETKLMRQTIRMARSEAVSNQPLSLDLLWENYERLLGSGQCKTSIAALTLDRQERASLLLALRTCADARIAALTQPQP